MTWWTDKRAQPFDTVAFTIACLATLATFVRAGLLIKNATKTRINALWLSAFAVLAVAMLARILFACAPRAPPDAAYSFDRWAAYSFVQLVQLEFLKTLPHAVRILSTRFIVGTQYFTIVVSVLVLISAIVYYSVANNVDGIDPGASGAQLVGYWTYSLISVIATLLLVLIDIFITSALFRFIVQLRTIPRSYKIRFGILATLLMGFIFIYIISVFLNGDILGYRVLLGTFSIDFCIFFVLLLSLLLTETTIKAHSAAQLKEFSGSFGDGEPMNQIPSANTSTEI